MAKLSDEGGTTSNIDAYLSDSPEISDSTMNELLNHSKEYTPNRMRSLDYSIGKVLYSRDPVAGAQGKVQSKVLEEIKRTNFRLDQIASHLENFHERLQSVESRLASIDDTDESNWNVVSYVIFYWAEENIDVT